MPQPTPLDVHVNRPLTNISVAYQQAASKYIADRVFPRVPVSKQTDQFFTYPKGEWFRTDAQVRAPATESAGSGYTLSTDTYRCEVYAVHKDIDDQTRANADQPINLDREATQFVTNQLLLKRDKDWATNFLTTGVWDKDLTGVSGTPSTNQFKQWDDAASDPIQTVQDAALDVERSTGFKPNTLVLGPDVWNQLRNHGDILDRIKYTQRGIVTEALVAAVFDVDRILVARAIENSANEGATASMDFMVGKSALLCYSAPNPGLMTPSAGYTFTWSGLLGASAFGSRITNFRIPITKVDRIEGEMAYDQNVIASDLGTFFASVVA